MNTTRDRERVATPEFMATQTNILYPLARGKTGNAVHIREALKGSPYECFGCSMPMVARQGARRQWHFAHKPPFERCADPDKALHDSATSMIIRGFRRALDQQRDYRLGCPCGECGRTVSRNIAVPGAVIEAERSVVAGTRSDLVIGQTDRGPVVIEVVVTHDLEPEAQEAYKESAIPVLKVRPTWDTLFHLESEVITDDTLNVPPVRCSDCKYAEQRHRQEQVRTRRRADSILRRMNERRPTDPGSLPFRPWTHDKFGRPMFSDIRRRVFVNAIILTELGFVQAKTSPWVFVFRLSGGVVFANFGSTDEVAIWEDTSALIHWKLDGLSEETESELAMGVLARCRMAGAEVRVSFYNLMLDYQEDTRKAGLPASVDRTVLNTLLAEAARSYPETERRRKEAREADREAERASLARQEAMEVEASRLRQLESDDRKRAEQERWAEFNEWFKRQSQLDGGKPELNE